MLCAIDTFTKYAWVKPLKDKKGKTDLKAFIEIANEPNQKPHSLWVSQGKEFHNKLMQEWLGNNYILMYSTLNEGKSVIVERFIKTLKAKIYKKTAANDSKSYLPYLNKIVDQYNNTYDHSTNEKPINADCSALTGKIKINPKGPKFKVNDSTRITKYKNILSKGFTESWSREIFIIISVLKLNPCTCKITTYR